jgi:acylphosphatase
MYGAPAPISEYVFEREALARNITLKPPSNSLNVRVEARGQVQKVGFRAWVAQAAEQLRLDGWTRNEGKDGLETVLSGPARDVSVLVSAMISGPDKARPLIVRNHTCNDPAREGLPCPPLSRLPPTMICCSECLRCLDRPATASSWKAHVFRVG